jgi:hypothetical protein
MVDIELTTEEKDLMQRVSDSLAELGLRNSPEAERIEATNLLLRLNRLILLRRGLLRGGSCSGGFDSRGAWFEAGGHRIEEN